MIKLSLISAWLGISFFWMSSLLDAFPTIATPQQEYISTSVTLLLLGSGLSSMAFWGKRPKEEE